MFLLNVAGRSRWRNSGGAAMREEPFGKCAAYQKCHLSLTTARTDSRLPAFDDARDQQPPPCEPTSPAEEEDWR